MLTEMKVEITLFKREGKMQLTTADGQYSNPLEWWKKTCSQILCAVLSCKKATFDSIATSAPSECIWRRVSSVLTMKHARLKPEVAAEIMYIRENLPLLRKYYVDIAVEERGEFWRAMIEMEKKYLPPIGNAEADMENDGNEIMRWL
jgi:hypothetical protein